MRADNSHHLRAAAQHRSEQTRRRAIAALRRMDATGKPINFDNLAREARVSRSWLYSQDDLRSEIERLRERNRPAAPSPQTPDRQRASDASLLRRLEAATNRIHRLGERRTAEILGQPTDRDTPNRKTSKIFGPC